jgi:DnaJ-class molecular chaperone
MKSDKQFERVCSLSISFARAALGGEINLKNIDVKMIFQIPSGTRPDSIVRMRGYDMPIFSKGNRGMGTHMRPLIFINKAKSLSFVKFTLFTSQASIQGSRL